MNERPSAAFTWPQALVALFVLIAFLFIFAAALLPIRMDYQASTTLSYIRELRIATQAMTFDNEKTHSPIRFTCSGDTPLTYGQWKQSLVPAYLSEKDFKNFTRVKVPRMFAPSVVVDNAITVFAVTDSDPSNTILFATKNWHGPGTTLSGQPYDHHLMVYITKSDDGGCLGQNTIAERLSQSGGAHNFLPLTGNE